VCASKKRRRPCNRKQTRRRHPNLRRRSEGSNHSFHRRQTTAAPAEKKGQVKWGQERPTKLAIVNGETDRLATRKGIQQEFKSLEIKAQNLWVKNDKTMNNGRKGFVKANMSRSKGPVKSRSGIQNQNHASSARKTPTNGGGATRKYKNASRGESTLRKPRKATSKKNRGKKGKLHASPIPGPLGSPTNFDKRGL